MRSHGLYVPSNDCMYIHLKPIRRTRLLKMLTWLNSLSDMRMRVGGKWHKRWQRVVPRFSLCPPAAALLCTAKAPHDSEWLCHSAPAGWCLGHRVCVRNVPGVWVCVCVCEDIFSDFCKINKSKDPSRPEGILEVQSGDRKALQAALGCSWVGCPTQKQDPAGCKVTPPPERMNGWKMLNWSV